MKPIISVILFVLVCAIARIEGANARLQFPLDKLELLSLVKRAVENDDIDSDTSSGDSSDSSSSSEYDESSPTDQRSHPPIPATSQSPKSTTKDSSSSNGSTKTTSAPTGTAARQSSNTNSSMKPGNSGSSSIPTSRPVFPPGSSGGEIPPCSNSGGSSSGSSSKSGGSDSGENTGIIDKMEHRVNGFLTGLIVGTKARVLAIEHAIGSKIARIGMALRNLVTKLIIEPIKYIFSPITRFFEWLRSCFAPVKTNPLLNSDATEDGAESNSRRIRSVTDISVPVSVSSNHSLWERFEELIDYLEHTSPKERERLKRIVWVVWCLLSDWMHYDTCKDQTANNIREFYATISSQATLKNFVSWIDEHLKSAVNAGLMSRDRAMVIHTICQTIELLLSLTM